MAWIFGNLFLLYQKIGTCFVFLSLNGQKKQVVTNTDIEHLSSVNDVKYVITELDQLYIGKKKVA